MLRFATTLAAGWQGAAARQMSFPPPEKDRLQTPVVNHRRRSPEDSGIRDFAFLGVAVALPPRRKGLGSPLGRPEEWERGMFPRLREPPIARHPAAAAASRPSGTPPLVGGVYRRGSSFPRFPAGRQRNHNL
jgi:hypothetical protein